MVLTKPTFFYKAFA